MKKSIITYVPAEKNMSSITHKIPAPQSGTGIGI
jgi:hypothetical protein